MRKTVDFLNALQNLKDWNDFRISRELRVSNQAVSTWRTGRSTFGNEAAVRVAELLEIEPEYVLACMHAERNDSELARPFLQRLVARARGPKALKLYRQIARAAKAGAIPVAVAAALLSGVYALPVDRPVTARDVVCILSKIKRIRRKAA